MPFATSNVDSGAPPPAEALDATADEDRARAARPWSSSVWAFPPSAKYAGGRNINVFAAFLLCVTFSSQILMFWKQTGPDISVRPQANEKREVFFHVHLAKTAGSSLNRVIARRYYGVCGHKGYSFSQTLNGTVRATLGDAGFNLDRVHPQWMSDWGYHNCALISHEINHSGFSKIAAMDFFENVSKTLIIPCRDPIDHLLSQCNHRGRNFTAIESNATNCTVVVNSCRLAWDRYDNAMLDNFDSIVLFKYDEFDELLRRLDGSLPRRAVSLETDGYYRTNKDREKVNEHASENCSWEALKEGLTHSWSYYKLCDKHLGKQKYAEVQREDILLK